MSRPARTTALLLACLALAGAAGKGAPKISFAPLREKYVKSFFRRFPVVATYLGAAGLDPELAALDGKLRDFSPTALREEKLEWAGFSADLAKVDRAALSEADRVDAEAMAAQLAFLERSLARKLHERALDATLDEGFRGVEWLLQGMSAGDGEKRGTVAEWQRVAERVEAVPGYLRTALANTRRGVAEGVIPDRRLIRGAVETALSSAAWFEKDLPAQAAAQMPGGSDALRERVAKGAAAASKALLDYRRGLLDLFFGPGGDRLKPEFERDRFAIGTAEYAWALRNDLRVAKSPQEIFRDGRERVTRTLQEMTVLARSIAAAREWTDASLPAVLAKLSEDAPKSDEEMLAWYRAGTERLVAFGRSERLFAIPDDYRLDIVFTPPPLRDTPGAAYYPAPAFKKSGVGRFYVTPTGNDPTLLRQSPRASVAALAAHEGFPGHDWQYRFLRAHADRISPVRSLLPGGVEDSSSMWCDSMATEGWAFYAEELAEKAYSPEERLFFLQSRILREARTVIDPGLHCGFLGFDEAVGYYARNVLLLKGPLSQDPAKNPDAAERALVESAEREVYRYSKWPAQAVTYLLGKQEILDLKAETAAIEKERFEERRFHEELLLEGTVPQGMVREALLSKARRRAAAP